jgi:hypothetical protein
MRYLEAEVAFRGPAGISKCRGRLPLVILFSFLVCIIEVFSF